MATFSVNLTDAKEFTMCGKGEHNFKITSADLKDYTKDGETRQKIELTCEVFGGEDGGAKVFYSIFLKNPTGLYMFLNRVGVSIEKKEYTNLDTNKLFVGKTFIANVEHDTYQKSDGSTGTKAVIVETSIRKYVNLSSEMDIPDEIETDPFEDFGNSVSIDDQFLD